MWESFVGSFWLTGVLFIMLAIAALYWVEFCDGLMAILIIPAFVAFVFLNDKLSDKVNIWDWFLQHRLECLIGAAVYFPLGTVYSVFRLWRYAAKMKENAIRDFYQRSSIRYSSQELTEDAKTQLANAIASAKAKVEFNMKGKILGWIAIWPISGIWYLISDTVREILNWIYARMAHYYQRLVDHVFRTE